MVQALYVHKESNLINSYGRKKDTRKSSKFLSTFTSLCIEPRGGSRWGRSPPPNTYCTK